MIERRAGGEPLQYVLGRWGFRKLDLLVDRRVLIPRPETEQVVEVALSAWRAAGPHAERVLVDLGTGSGAIALSLATETDGDEVWATDVSEDALAVARANLAGLGGLAATRVRMVRGSWWDALPRHLKGRVSLAVSNPPYVPSAAMRSLPTQVRDWEPAAALDGGADGLDAIRQILAPARQWLEASGVLVLEIGDDQPESAREAARAAGFARVEIHPDLAGCPRAMVALNQDR